MMNHIKRLLKEEDGAITVDWVVLTAAIVGLGIAVAGTIASGALNTSSGLGAQLSSQSISSTF